MTSKPLSRRAAITGLAGSAAAAGLTRPAQAAPTKIKFLTSWFAEAEHGGFYGAKATGLYEKAGLDVDIAMGGPQVNGLQLLTGGAADIIIGYDIQVLKGLENGLPITTIAAAMQFELQGVMTHDDIKSIADLKGHKILIAAAAHQTFWPWLKQRFGFTDDMAGVDTFNLQPFIQDKTLAMQGYPTSEPFEAKRAGQNVNFYLFADAGYPPYGTTMVTTNNFIQKNPEATAAFVKASLEGWRDYLQNPAPANKLIKIDNPRMSDGQIAYSIDLMKQMRVLDRGDVPVGTMTEARWQATKDFLVKAGLLKPSVDIHKAYTTQFIDGLNIRA